MLVFISLFINSSLIGLNHEKIIMMHFSYARIFSELFIADNYLTHFAVNMLLSEPGSGPAENAESWA